MRRKYVAGRIIALYTHTLPRIDVIANRLAVIFMSIAASTN